MLANKQTNKETIQQILEVINMDEESFKFKDNKSLFNKVSKKRDCMNKLLLHERLRDRGTY